MDFGRVKILLIIVFIGLNAFLLYQWSVLRTSVSIYTEPVADQIANIKRTLAGHKVNMVASLPDIQPTMSMYKVAATSELFAQTAQLAVLANKKIVSKSHSSIANRLGKVKWLAPDQVQVTFKTQTAATVIQRSGHLSGLRKWLSHHVYNFASYQYLSDHVVNGDGYVDYVEVMSGFPIYSAPLTVELKKGKIIRFSQTSVSEVTAVHPRTVMSVTNALLALASYMDKAHLEIDNTIEEVQIGYFSKIMINSTGYISPVWMVYSTHGVFYVNAQNGEVSVQN